MVIVCSSVDFHGIFSQRSLYGMGLLTVEANNDFCRLSRRAIFTVPNQHKMRRAVASARYVVAKVFAVQYNTISSAQIAAADLQLTHLPSSLHPFERRIWGSNSFGCQVEYRQLAPTRSRTPSIPMSHHCRGCTDSISTPHAARVRRLLLVIPLVH